jgi:hypothetical protein
MKQNMRATIQDGLKVRLLIDENWIAGRVEAGQTGQLYLHDTGNGNGYKQVCILWDNGNIRRRCKPGYYWAIAGDIGDLLPHFLELV